MSYDFDNRYEQSRRNQPRDNSSVVWVIVPVAILIVALVMRTVVLPLLHLF